MRENAANEPRRSRYFCADGSAPRRGKGAGAPPRGKRNGSAHPASKPVGRRVASAQIMRSAACRGSVAPRQAARHRLERSAAEDRRERKRPFPSRRRRGSVGPRPAGEWNGRWWEQRVEAARSGRAGRARRTRPWPRAVDARPASLFGCWWVVFGLVSLVVVGFCGGRAYVRERYALFPLFIVLCSRFRRWFFGFSTAVLLHRL